MHKCINSQPNPSIGSVIYNSILVTDSDEGNNGSVTVNCDRTLNADVSWWARTAQNVNGWVGKDGPKRHWMGGQGRPKTSLDGWARTALNVIGWVGVD